MKTVKTELFEALLIECLRQLEMQCCEGYIDRSLFKAINTARLELGLNEYYIEFKPRTSLEPTIKDTNSDVEHCGTLGYEEDIPF